MTCAARWIALVRDHLRPGECTQKQVKSAMEHFDASCRRCELELLYRVAAPDSLGRNATVGAREHGSSGSPGMVSFARARELQVRFDGAAKFY